jgi:nitrate/nitrite transporter NarK
MCGSFRDEAVGGILQPTETISRAESEPAAPAQRSRSPWLILSLLFLLTVIMFIARQALGVMAPVLRDVFHLSNAAYGRIVSCLGFGMMTGEFPMGYLMDRLGSRLGLSIAVAWWSAATGSLALAGSGVAMGLSQFWKGTGECGAYSGGVKTVSRLFEKKDRTLAIGIFNGGSVIGTTIAIPLIAYLLRHCFPCTHSRRLSVDPFMVADVSPRAEEQSQLCNRCFAGSDAGQLVDLRSDAVPILHWAGDAVLLVLDAALSLQRAAYDHGADRFRGLDSVPDG